MTDSMIDSLSAFPESSSDGISVSALAFLGDGVWGLMMREYLTATNLGKADKLHEMNIEMVNATYQARAAKAIEPLLSVEEKGIFIRGRNAHTAHTPRHKSKSEYHAATALETLFGWLYINGRTSRIKELFDMIINLPGSEVKK